MLVWLNCRPQQTKIAYTTRPFLAVAYLGGIWWCPLASHTYNFYEKNLQGQCVDVWYETFCCRHINFKTMFQRASDHIIFILKLNKKFWRGALPLRRPHPPAIGKTTSCTQPHRRLLGLDSRAFRARPSAPLSKILNTPLIPSRLAHSTDNMTSSVA